MLDLTNYISTLLRDAPLDFKGVGRKLVFFLKTLYPHMEKEKKKLDPHMEGGKKNLTHMEEKEGK